MKKNALRLCNLMKYSELTHLIRIMRTIFFLIFVFVFQLVASDADAQKAKVNISKNVLPLGELITEIEKQTDYLFVYSDAEINVSEQVKVNARNKPVDDVLEQAFNNGSIAYEYANNYISLRILSENEKQTIRQQSQKRISGVIIDSDGETIIGANVIEKGTTNGVITDLDGKFSLLVNDNAILQISYIGYLTQEVEVGNRNVINVTLETNTLIIDEVVVTALGLQREKKALGYAVQEVGGGDIAKSKELDVINALAGRVSGVHITQGGGGVGSNNSRIVIRGENSIAGKNEPLYIIDGVPGSSDDVSSDDIESISVLKGPAASALYGSRALSGVVVITTKTGKGKTGLNVEVNSSSMFQNPLVLPSYQSEYGQGVGGVYRNTTDQSWGAKLNAGEGNSNNAKDFYNTGHVLTNNASVTKTDDKSSFRLSYTNVTQKGIVPNTDYNSNRFDFSASKELFKGFTVNGNVKFTKNNSDNNQSEDPRLWPTSLDLKDLKDYWITEGEQQKIWSANNDNPYFKLYENTNPMESERWFTNFSFSYDFLKHFSLMGRVSYISESGNQEWYTRVGSEGWADGRERKYGGYKTKMWRNKELNTDFLLSYNNNFFDDVLSFKASAGGNHTYQSYSNYMEGQNYMLGDVPVYTLGNYRTYTRVTNNYGPNKIVNSFYAFANLGYKNRLYLDLTARNDWSSALPSNNNSYFYPSASLSALVTEFFELPKVISFWKVRGSFAMVGNDTDAGQLQPDYSFTEGSGGVAGIEEGGIKREYNLKPELASSFEIGTDIRFFNNRLNLDVNYYKTTTRNQIWNVAVSEISGYSSAMKNAGKVSSHGLEVSLQAIPVMTKDFTWSTTVNWSFDRSKIVELDSENPDLVFTTKIKGTDGLYTYDKAGQRRGSLYSRYSKKFEYDPSIHSADLAAYNGAILHDPGKKIQRSDDLAVLGNYNPDWIGSWYNSFQYKDFNLSFLLFTNYGNSFYTGFEKALYSRGLAPETGTARNNGGVLPTGHLWQVIADDPGSIRPFQPGDEIDSETYYKEHIGDGENNDYWIRDGSFLKLKELTFTYNLPKRLLSRTFINSASISLIGRNLAVWSKVKHVDPEGYSSDESENSVPGTSTLSAGIPSTRNIGFSVNIKF